MDLKELSTFLGNHCRFKFRNGRDIYGVIWESNARYFFSSKERHDSLLINGLGAFNQSTNTFNQINPEDILKADKLEMEEE
ncbi:MAG: hypothetical protein ACI8XB_001943 [Patiriisocius sp.]|jgi:hypothetical protein